MGGNGREDSVKCGSWMGEFSEPNLLQLLTEDRNGLFGVVIILYFCISGGYVIAWDVN